MNIKRIIGNRAGRFLTALLLAYALLLQVIVPQTSAFAAETGGGIICLSPGNTNSPDSPLKRHQDCTNPALCAAVSVAITPEIIAALVPPRTTAFAISGAASEQAQALHLWNGVNARGPPQA